MGDLTGQTVASTYSQLLNVASLDATYRNVTAGSGTATGLSISTSGIRAADLNATGAVTFNSTLGVTGLITATGGVSGAVTGNVTGNVIGNITGNLTGVVTGNVTGNVIGNVTGSADTLTTGRTIAATGDIAWTSPAFDGSGNVTAAATISDLSISTGKIADDAVTADKLADTAVSAGSYTSADITVDAQGRLTAASSSAATTHPTMRIQGFTTTGSDTWTAPTGVTRAKFTIVGGGGGGASGDQGGGSGSTVIASVAVTASTAYSVTVGAGAGAGASGNAGTSSVVVGATTYSAGGGETGGVGGTAGANGDIKLDGRDGEGTANQNETPAPIISHYGTGGGAPSSGVARAGQNGIIIVEWME